MFCKTRFLLYRLVLQTKPVSEKRVFFYSLLQLWDGIKFFEQSPALPFSNKDLVSLRQVVAEKFSIPQILFIPEAPWTAAQIFPKRFHLFFSERWRSPIARNFFKSGKSTALEPVDPVLHRTRTVAEEFRHFITAPSRADEQNPVQPMIVSGFIGTVYLLLYRNLHYVRFFDFEFAHLITPFRHSVAERFFMRNYL